MNQLGEFTATAEYSAVTGDHFVRHMLYLYVEKSALLSAPVEWYDEMAVHLHAVGTQV